MIFALQLSQKFAGLQMETQDLNVWLEGLGYQTNLPKGLSFDALIKRMKSDKKSIDGQIRFVLLNEIGTPQINELSEEVILEELKQFSR